MSREGRAQIRAQLHELAAHISKRGDVLFRSSRTIARWKNQVQLEAISAVLRPAPPTGRAWAAGKTYLR